jgi:NAD(P)-dependent dehydrogenase (short-subunit alcohol dehydrogenase family)
MKDKGWGRIINIVGSLVERPAARYSAHIAAKAALLAMTRTLALEFAPLGITVNAVSPGVVATEATRALRQKVLDSLIRKTPLGRLASAEEVAAAVVFLASPEANYITGAHLPVDGGLAVA